MVVNLAVIAESLQTGGFAGRIDHKCKARMQEKLRKLFRHRWALPKVQYASNYSQDTTIAQIIFHVRSTLRGARDRLRFFVKLKKPGLVQRPNNLALRHLDWNTQPTHKGHQ